MPFENSSWSKNSELSVLERMVGSCLNGNGRSSKKTNVDKF